ncbi:hypothetical protein Pfo_001959 [Paulownia fortunei]|nr:hypothetical protein Pfo_001959 [Paulownia fortunei]
MFDGVPSDQLHQFIASRTSFPIPPSFPLHGNPSFSAAFDPYPSSHHSQALQELHHQESPNSKNIDAKHVENPLISTSLALERERSMDPWSNDEVLALLKVRSSMEIWFPDFTWEHVSRKFAELGFKRSAEQCKEKYEEESRHFNSVNYNKNYRIFSELDEFYPADQEEARISAGRSQNMEKQNEVDQEKVYRNVEENSGNVAAAAAENPSQESEEVDKKPVKSSKKRKRKDKLEMFKGFCEAVVKKMMAQQEELHNKLIEDIVKRDEDKIVREEAWKNKEMERIKIEIEMRRKEQAGTRERQATIIEFLKKFTSEDQHLAKKIEYLVKVNNTWNSSPSLCEILQTHHFPTAQDKVETSTSSSKVAAHQNPRSFPSQNNPKATKTPSRSPPSPSSSLVSKDSKANTLISALTNDDTPLAAFTPPSSTHLDSTTYERGDIGKRWPRDEVLALINLRCKLSNNSDHDSKEGAKGPLWERISQGMLELGYKRSAKRCKEKWENINKYFRKTKDSNKKRSTNSRTCPYFHQLSCLYSEGTLQVAPTNVPEDH